jgi:hypothetical protein
MEIIIQLINKNMAGLTLEQLQSMGAVPKTAPTTGVRPVPFKTQGNVSTSKPSLGGGLTLQQLQQMGASPKMTSQPTQEQLAQQRRSAGLPVGKKADGSPTLAGSIIREIAKVPVKTGLQLARAVVDPLAKRDEFSVNSKYLGNVGDYQTEIQKRTDNLADKYNAGEISAGRAILGGAGAGALQAMDFASVLPIGATGSALAKGAIPTIAEQGVLRTIGKSIIPTSKQALKEASIRGGAVGGGYDVSEQLASGEKYNPLRTAGAVAAGTVLDFAATKGLPEAFNMVKDVAGRYTPTNALGRLVNKAEKDIFDIQNNYVKTRKKMDYSKDAQASNRRRVASSGVLTGTVDAEGKVRTTQPGGAVEKYRNMTIDGSEGIVRETLSKEGRSVNPAIVARDLKRNIESNPMIKGEAKTSALAKVAREVEAYARDAQGNIPLTELHDAKIAMAKTIKDFATPEEVKAYQKSLRAGLQNIVENNSSENIKDINKELSKFYQDLEILELLDGKKVNGGKLGKYFSQIAGNVAGAGIGSVLGPAGAAVGAIAGGEIGSGIRSKIMSKTFGNIPLGGKVTSEVLDNAKNALSRERIGLPAPDVRNLKPTGSFTPRGDVIELPANLNQANAEAQAIRDMQERLPARGIPLEFTQYPEAYIPQENLPTIDAGTVPKTKANLPTINFDSGNVPKSTAYDDVARNIKFTRKVNDFVNEPYVADKDLPTINFSKKKTPAKVPLKLTPKPKEEIATIQLNDGIINSNNKVISRAKEFVKKQGNNNAAYAMFGMEIDEDGKVSFDPKKAALGFAVGGFAQTKAGKEAIDSLNKKAVEVFKNPTRKAVDAIKKEIERLTKNK